MQDLITSIIPMIQYPASACTVIAYYFIGSNKSDTTKIRFGFVLGLLGNLVWILYALFPIQWGLIITNAFILSFGIRGYLNNTIK
jgi:hypothetical protein